MTAVFYCKSYKLKTRKGLCTSSITMPYKLQTVDGSVHFGFPANEAQEEEGSLRQVTVLAGVCAEFKS